jgi:hypothetical protein
MSGNIFDNMSDEGNREFQAPAGNEGVFTVQFGTESVDVSYRQGMTIKEAFVMKSDYLGFDPDRVMAYRDNHNNLLDGNEVPEVGVVYSASITHDEKG